MGGIFATILYCEVFINLSLKHNAWTVIKLLLYSESQMNFKIKQVVHAAWSRYRIIFCYFDRNLVFE